MIGNTILFSDHIMVGDKYLRVEMEGLVVDAFTKVTGEVNGGSFLGIGETKGSTDSRRMYKVEHYQHWDKGKEYSKYYKDISAGSLVKIIHFANSNQEVNEEKIRL